MPPEAIPKDPVYMSYITRHHQEVKYPSPHRTMSPFRPASGLTYTDLQLQSSRGVYPHFHRPFNDHSRYLATASGPDRNMYRDLPRQSPPPWDGSSPLDYDPGYFRRPASAPSAARGTILRGGSPTPGPRLDLAGAILTDNMTTATGRPCYTMTTLVDADVDSGLPVVLPEEDLLLAEGADWRLRRVQTYQVPTSIVGYGTGGARPFHQDYRHYKYFGFGGQGAKTSWGHNPKYNRTYGELFSSSSSRDPGAPPLANQNTPAAPPLQQMVGGPRRRLTPAEKALVKQFRSHNYGTEGVPSDPNMARKLAQIATGTYYPPGALRRSKLQQQDNSYPQSYREIIEPYRTRVDLDRRQSLHAAASPSGRDSSRTAAGTSLRPNSARVATYRQMSSPYAGELNRSPNHGSQSPWHQRYGHYKYAGFAGKGASSSWARNPKYAYMYD